MKNINKGLRLIQCIQIIGLLLVLSAGLFLVSPIAQAFTFTIIDVPGSEFTSALGISSSVQIVGFFIDSVPSTHGFLLNKKGNLTTIDPPDSVFTEATGISPSGKLIVGTFTTDATVKGFLLKKGKFTTIDVPGASSTNANGVNSSGDIVGSFGDSSGVIHGFLLSKRLRPNNTQNQALAVNGIFTTVIDVPGAFSTNANGVNSSGDIVGSFTDSSNVGHGFLLDKKGNFTTIDVPGASVIGTSAFGINDSGQIVGDFGDSRGGHGFLLDEKGNFTTIDVPGAIDTIASGINASGDIVGNFRDSSNVGHGFFASP